MIKTKEKLTTKYEGVPYWVNLLCALFVVLVGGYMIKEALCMFWGILC